MTISGNENNHSLGIWPSPFSTVAPGLNSRTNAVLVKFLITEWIKVKIIV